MLLSILYHTKNSERLLSVLEVSPFNADLAEGCLFYDDPLLLWGESVLFYRGDMLLLSGGYRNPDNRGPMTSPDSLPHEFGIHKKPRTSIYLSQKITFCAWETQRCDLHPSWWFVQCERPTGKEVIESLPCWTPGQNKMYRVMSYWKSLAVPLQSHWLLSSTTPILSPFINLLLRQRVSWLRGFVSYTILFYSFHLRTLIL